MGKKVAIHQPNFFPWLGYFDKIVSSDIFIILDDVQFPKTNGTWLNRVQMIVAAEPKWVTAPIRRDYHGTLNINEMFFDEKAPWRQKMVKTIEGNYRKADFYKENIDFITGLIINEESNIASYNTKNVISILDYLSIGRAHIRRSSSMPTESASTQRIIDLVKLAEGDTYYCGGGATGYQEDELYSENGINLVYQNYQHPEYTQKNDTGFVKGLSILDVLLNKGKEKTKEILFNK